MLADSTLMTSWINLNSKTAGKDKIARLLQYLSRLLRHLLQQRSLLLRDASGRLQTLEALLSTFRKVLRLGKSLEVLYGALSTLRLSDPVLRVTTTLSRCHLAIFLLLDNILCLARGGLLSAVNLQATTDSANRFWLASILMNLVRDFYEIWFIARGGASHHRLASHSPASVATLRPNTSRGSCSTNDCSALCCYQTWPITAPIYNFIPITQPIFRFAEHHRAVCLDTARNLCDVALPLTSLGKLGLSPGMVGALGTLSSYIAIITLLDPAAKLSPA